MHHLDDQSIQLDSIIEFQKKDLKKNTHAGMWCSWQFYCWLEHRYMKHIKLMLSNVATSSDMQLRGHLKKCIGRCETLSKHCFSRMRSKGSRFTLGVWGLRVRSLDFAQTFATVRNRSREGRMAVPMVSSCRRGHFWRFQTSRCLVSRGRHGTSWHSDAFGNVSKIVLCGGRNTFATFSQDKLQFSWQAQHFGRGQRHFAGQAQAL
jgi:hypothetical protein